MRFLLPWLATLLLLVTGCDHGLAPPDAAVPGAIRGIVTYADLAAWPPSDSLVDLRFVAMTFIPRDTADFLQLNRLTFSEMLALHVARDTFFLGDVAPDTFVYSGVAQRYGPDLLSWRPVGLYEADGGVFTVRSGEVTEIEVEVDFRNPPPFPPPP